MQPPVLGRGAPLEFGFTTGRAFAQKIRRRHGVNRVVGCTCHEPRQPETRRFTWHARQRYLDGDVGSDLAATTRKDSEEKHDSGAEKLRQATRSEPWDPARGPTVSVHLWRDFRLQAAKQVGGACDPFRVRREIPRVVTCDIGIRLSGRRRIRR